jgi:hypothetical protein
MSASPERGASPEASVPGWSFSIAGVPVRVEAGSASLATRLWKWLADAFVLERADCAGPRPLLLRVRDGARPPSIPSRAIELAAEARWRVQRDGSRIHLSFSQAFCDLDLSTGLAMLWLGSGWWREPLKSQQELWLLTLIWLLRERGRYALHASAVARDGRALLMAGESGSGKSSTALSLIHTGWDWLADDVVLLEPATVPRLHGLARGFAFHPELAQRLPGLTGEAVAEKQFVEIGGLYPTRRADASRPAALLFPKVTGVATSRMERLSNAETLAALLPASGGILTAGAQAQMTALRDLVSAVPGYRLHAGQDIFGNGRAVEMLLRTHRLALGSG